MADRTIGDRYAMKTHATPRESVAAAHRRRTLATRDREVRNFADRLELARRNAAAADVEVLDDAPTAPGVTP
jgi:hypothetical protein